MPPRQQRAILGDIFGAPDNSAVVHVGGNFIIRANNVKTAAIDGGHHVFHYLVRQPRTLLMFALARGGPAGHQQVTGDVAVIVIVVA